jgi:hypothetical protein
MADSSPDNIYVNIDFQAPLGNSQPIPLRYNTTRASDMVSKASDYYCSVVRFNLPLSSIPNLICPIVPNQADPTLTPWQIGVSNGNPGNFNTVSLKYIDNSNLALPTQDKPSIVVSPALFIYNYQVVIDMMNGALLQAYNAANLAAVFPALEAPFFYFDPTTQLINLVASLIFSLPLQSPLIAVPTIYINNALKVYLDSFEYISNGFNNPNGNDWIFRLNKTITFSAIVHQVYPTLVMGYAFPGDTITQPPSYYLYTQIYPAMAFWSASSKLFFTTGSIPVNEEYLPSLTNGQTNSNQIPILTDFVLDLSSSTNNRDVAYYVPTSQYRLVDLNAGTPINTIDIQVYWQDQYLNYWPLNINAGQQANIKIAFIKKSMYKETKKEVEYNLGSQGSSYKPRLNYKM